MCDREWYGDEKEHREPRVSGFVSTHSEHEHGKSGFSGLIISCKHKENVKWQILNDYIHDLHLYWRE